MSERQDAKEELRAQIWLPADTSRRLRAIATRAGLRPEQVLAQLADHAVLNDDGSLTVASLHPTTSIPAEPCPQLTLAFPGTGNA
ncbi:hypothetical protein [Streptomyces sp. NPDC006140]|uniref:hypothetical protein n=1 Tax=Streptomyces sp. NPDC006140 TaxID=3154579 RepID=UPI0033D2C7B7